MQCSTLTTLLFQLLLYSILDEKKYYYYYIQRWLLQTLISKILLRLFLLKMKLSYFKKPLIAAPSKFWKWGLFIRIFQWRRLQQGMVISRKGQKRKKRLEKVNSGQLCPSQCVFKGRYVDFFYFRYFSYFFANYFSVAEKWQSSEIRT